MSTSMLWWIAAGAVVGAELLTGTVYLLLLSIGMAAAGLTARMGAPLPGQMLVCAVVGGVAMALLWWWRLRTARGQATAEFDLDIGHRVHVARWQPDGLATVHYRGAPWQACWQGDGPPPGPGDYAIVAVDGARLVLGALPSTRAPRAS
jgi:membrane protein implicated in regulation of membrane protease activity